MASDLQYKANRENAAKSRGALTPETKAISSMNSLRHGLTSAKRILPGESYEEYQNVFQAVFDHYKPATALEEIVIREIADQHWKILRVPGVELNFQSMNRSRMPAAMDLPKDELNSYFEADTYTCYYKEITSLSLQLGRAQRQLERKILQFKEIRRERELVQKVAADMAEASAMNGSTSLHPQIGVVFSHEYIMQRAAFKKYNPKEDVTVFDRMWGDPKAKMSAWAA